MKKYFSTISFILFLIFGLVNISQAQNFSKDFPLKTGGTVEIKNLYGRIDVVTDETKENEVSILVNSSKDFSESDLEVKSSAGRVRINVISQNTKKRIDFVVKVSPRSRVVLKTEDGEIRVVGDFKEAQVETNTGTIYADVSLENLKYRFTWTGSRPRFLSDVELEEFKEKSAGRFEIKGSLNEKKDEKDSPKQIEDENLEDNGEENNSETDEPKKEKKKKKKKKNDDLVKLNFTTARGIVLLNVSPNEVPANLTERPLTEAAKAIIRSGDSLLMNAIRRASPKYFGEYSSTLPPRKATPTLGKSDKRLGVNASVKRATVQVVDINNRAISGLKKDDFILTERGEEREVLSVSPTTAPFNLVLLLDVSGSVEHYVDFIRKAARNFVNTVGTQDKVSIVTFNDDVKRLSGFTTDRAMLSESLDTFDAGGGTAYYDSLGYSLTEVLRPLKGERTAIVVLSDGEDNRSFLPFRSLLGSIQESGALIYPLYVPSGLIASATNNPNAEIDPLRNRFLSLTLTSKAQEEGETLAKISGGVYYPISRLSELQQAYNDIVLQLRTAYTITYRSTLRNTNGNRVSPSLRVKVKNKTAFVKLRSVVPVNEDKGSKVKQHKTKSRKELRNFFRKTNYNPNKKSLQKKTVKIPEITGEIDRVNYRQFVADKLRTHDFETFDINKTRGAFLVSKDEKNLAISRWVSPKRTRSYPYERVYDTLAQKGKKVAIIPVVKDEGTNGDRDFIQWDTISLLSLLDVHVILAYYDDAIKNPRKEGKITKQKFNNAFIKTKLAEILNFKETPRNWNEKEARNLKNIFQKAKFAYCEISKKTETELHSEEKLDELIKYTETPQRFIGYSRRKSRNAQTREFLTIQPKEALSTLSKAKVTITNALFGKYYFTVDETLVEPKTISLIEAKHTNRSNMPSKNDIKDGLIKMMLYTNLQRVKFDEKPVKYKVAIRLTSKKLEGSINSNASNDELESFATKNLIKSRKLDFLKKLFKEAKANNFTVILERGEISKLIC